MSDRQQNENQEVTKEDIENLLQDSSFKCEEFNYGDLEQSAEVPVFEFSSPISSISSTCSSPDRTAQPRELYTNDLDMDVSDEFVSLEELRSQISPPSDDEFGSNSATLVRKSTLETIFEDEYLETPPSTPSSGLSEHKKRKRRLVRTDLSKCDEFKENVQMNS